MYLYEYAYTGHFWVKGYEYLRQLEYRLAILRDKYDYLGEEYCTEEEKRLAALVEFSPLNYCCYPAVPEKYIVPREDPWVPSEEAITYMKELSAECGDISLEKSWKHIGNIRQNSGQKELQPCFIKRNMLQLWIC